MSKKKPPLPGPVLTAAQRGALDRVRDSYRALNDNTAKWPSKPDARADWFMITACMSHPSDYMSPFGPGPLEQWDDIRRMSWGLLPRRTKHQDSDGPRAGEKHKACAAALKAARDVFTATISDEILPTSVIEAHPGNPPPEDFLDVKQQSDGTWIASLKPGVYQDDDGEWHMESEADRAVRESLEGEDE